VKPRALLAKPLQHSFVKDLVHFQMHLAHFRSFPVHALAHHFALVHATADEFVLDVRDGRGRHFRASICRRAAPISIFIIIIPPRLSLSVFIRRDDGDIFSFLLLPNQKPPLVRFFLPRASRDTHEERVVLRGVEVKQRQLLLVVVVFETLFLPLFLFRSSKGGGRGG
jgi:hypothetical protein